MNKLSEKHSLFSQIVAEGFQWLLNISLIAVGGVLVYALFAECLELVRLLVSHSEKFQLIEKIVMFFLYFEFLALIVQYFRYSYHFPLRYFLYIGITAMIRLIIVDHSNALHTLFFAGAILVMVIALFIVNTERLRRS